MQLILFSLPFHGNSDVAREYKMVFSSSAKISIIPKVWVPSSIILVILTLNFSLSRGCCPGGGGNLLPNLEIFPGGEVSKPGGGVEVTSNIGVEIVSTFVFHPSSDRVWERLFITNFIFLGL